MDIELRRLPDIDKAEIIELMNNPLVLKHMPLASPKFGDDACEKFLASKERLWEESGYGPWAFVLNGKFIGWGGLQPAGGDVEIAIVLHPAYWGFGKTLYEKIIRYAFETLNIESVIILFPPSRTSIKGILRLGFKKEKETLLEGEPFIRYRLFNSRLSP